MGYCDCCMKLVTGKQRGLVFELKLVTVEHVQGVPEKTTFLKLIGSLIKPCCNGCSIF